MPREPFSVEGLCVDVQVLIQGVLQNNVYIISDGSATFAVDPCIDAKAIVNALDGAKLDAIVLTHYHWDHVGAAAELKALTGAPVIASATDAQRIENPSRGFASRQSAPCKVDTCVSDGEVMKIGGMQWKVIETPGHTPGSMCLFLAPEYGNHTEGCPVLIAGDMLFCGTYGRIDFEDSLPDMMPLSMKKLAALPDDTVVLPGHESLTTIGDERFRVFPEFGC